MLERLELERFAGRRLGTLSGGERQRLVIARALAQEAPILLLDEPTSALDIGHQQQALELVARLRREHGLTVVSAMHDLTLAGQYSDRLALLHEGQCVASRSGRRRAAGRDAGRVLRRAGHACTTSPTAPSSSSPAATSLPPGGDGAPTFERIASATRCGGHVHHRASRPSTGLPRPPRSSRGRQSVAARSLR